MNNIEFKLKTPRNFKTIESGVFKLFKSTSYKLPEKGWKIHVSSFTNDFNEILEITINFLFENNITFKYISNKEEFVKSIFNKKPSNLLGKSITIYPKDESQASFILENLESKLKNYDGPATFTDRQYKNSILHYRYGNFIKEEQRNLIKKYKPDDIVDPFQKEVKIKKNINKYEIVGLIYYDTYSNVWLVKYKNIFYILKELKYKNFYKEENHHKQNEFLISKDLRSSYFPKAVECWEEYNNSYYLYEFKQGSNLLTLKSHFCTLFGMEKDEKVNQIISLLSNIKGLLKYLKRKRLFLNDVKLDNFIWNEETKRLSFIDLEYSYLSNNKIEKEGFYKIINEYDDKSSLYFKNDKNKLFWMLCDLLFDYKLESEINFYKYISNLTYINPRIEKNIKELFSIFNLEFNKNISYQEDFIKLESLLNQKESNLYNLYNLSEPKEIFKILNNELNNNNFLFYEHLNVLITQTKEDANHYLKKWFIEIKKNFNAEHLFFNGKNNSPYLLDGTMGILYLLCFYSFRFDNNDFFDEIEKISKITLLWFSRKIGLGNGYAGILLVNHLISKIFLIDYLSLKNKYLIGNFYQYVKDEKILDYDFKEIDNSFLKGYKGLYFLLSIYKKESEVN
ncbi:hypothetical protein [Mycoplasmopsis felis]|uniref:class III lanthionine synthetase LanKC N-terminal domain-containing protein n=1 Tax=Mycoplasmopsis felis TaxID=33923 RepID=UPI003A4DDB4B